MMGTSSTALAGTLVYEARMAMRRRVLWLSLLPLIALSVLLALTSPVIAGLHDPVARISDSVLLVNLLCTVGVGVALADRFTQQHLPGLTELLDATPSGRTSRMAGVLLGPLAIALAPVAVTLLLLGTVAALTASSVAPVGAAVIGFLTAVVPGALALSTLAALLGLVLPLAVARILVIIGWFWATALSPSLLPVPTVTGTVLSPLGGYPAVAWLHATPMWANRELTGALRPTPDGTTAIVNVVTVLALAMLFFGVAQAISSLRR